MQEIRLWIPAKLVRNPIPSYVVFTQVYGDTSQPKKVGPVALAAIVVATTGGEVAITFVVVVNVVVVGTS